MTSIGYIDFRERKKRQGQLPASCPGASRQMQQEQLQEQQTVARGLLG